MSKYKISVVVPTYNTGKFLNDLFDSLKSQTIGFDNIEVIFVDDKSTDRQTLDLLKEFSSYDNVKVIYKDFNSGFPGEGRNIGLREASGEYIIFTDHDDSYNPDAFDTMYLMIEGDILITNYYKQFKDEKIPEKTNFNNMNIAIERFEEDLRLFDIGPSIWTKLFRREFLLKNDIWFLEGMLAEDLELYIHSLLKAKGIVYLDDFYSYNYKIRDEGGNKSTIHLRNKEILSKMIKGYYKTYELLEDLNQSKYFSNIFERHFVYWITSLMKSEIADEDKKELFKELNPLLKKQLAINPGFGERIYEPLTEPLLNDDFDKATKTLKKIKKSRNRKGRLKKLLKKF